MLGEEDHSFVRRLLAEHAGVDFNPEQSHLVDSRLASLARRRNLQGPSAIVDALRKAPSGALLDSVIDALTTHETSFFRDREPFVALTEQVFPELIRQRRRRRALSIWSAACSTGQEPYSVAMLLHEHFPELQGWRVRILGTDVSRSAVQQARQGCYSERELQRGVSPRAREKYFEPAGDAWQIRPFIRSMVSWESFSLTSAWPALGAFDLVLMRNVLIYFAADTRALILQRATGHLATDGYLLLGTSESTFGACDELQPSYLGPATVYRRTST